MVRPCHHVSPALSDPLQKERPLRLRTDDARRSRRAKQRTVVDAPRTNRFGVLDGGSGESIAMSLQRNAGQRFRAPPEGWVGDDASQGASRASFQASNVPSVRRSFEVPKTKESPRAADAHPRRDSANASSALDSHAEIWSTGCVLGAAAPLFGDSTMVRVASLRNRLNLADILRRVPGFVS
jgi:hypothetical protein